MRIAKPKALAPVLAASLPLLAASCKSVEFHPVEGPLSQLSPVPVITGTATGTWTDSGNLTVEMPDGEVCTGRWSVASNLTVASSFGSATAAAGGAWATVYGTGTAVASGGTSRGMAVLHGDRGTVLEVDFINGGGGHGHGVATDNRGNVYRMLY